MDNIYSRIRPGLDDLYKDGDLTREQYEKLLKQSNDLEGLKMPRGSNLFRLYVENIFLTLRLNEVRRRINRV